MSSKSLEFLTCMKDLNICVRDSPKGIESEKFEISLQKIKSFLLDETISEGWISKILSFFVNQPILRNEYNSLIRDLFDHFKYGKISHDHLQKILLKKDSTGFLIPEITLINGATTLYLNGYLEESVSLLSKIVEGVSIESSKEIAFLLYCLRDEEFFEQIVCVCKKIHLPQESNIPGTKTLKATEENRYDYLCRYASTKGLRSKYFSEIFFQSPKDTIIKEIFTEASREFSDPRILVMTVGIIFSFSWDLLSESDKEGFCNLLEEKIATEESENIKADILDLLARNFPEKNYREQIRSLGQKGGAQTFYENTQNIHIEGLEEKIFEFLEKQNLEDCFSEFSEWVVKNGNEDQKESLKRMEKDASLFMKKYTLQDVCSICWKKIISSENSEELKKRLLQEMSDMKDTCFTGHITRLMNVFTGFEEGFISIPWEAQIKANLVRKIALYVKNLEEEDSEKIVEQLDQDSLDKTLVYEMLEILMKELHFEFVGQGYLSPKEFELYSEKIIESYIS